ncbi:MAG TPA: hypothetical protein VM577_09450 [Anaerovoracaceae bacterium]|nr:hypothetical protein [Anaerovoracaceae bacterium]
MESKTGDLLSQVAEVVKGSTDAVQNRVKDTLVERELASRTDLLLKGLEKIREAKKELDKIRPDVESYDENGAKVHAHYTKAKLDERKKANELKDKLEKAWEQAFNGESFDKLRELVK